MRIDPEGVYLRLEPGATLINYKTGKTRTRPCVELHWKDGRRWARKTFVGSDEAPTLGAILEHLAKWLDSHPDIEAALDEVRS